MILPFLFPIKKNFNLKLNKSANPNFLNHQIPIPPMLILKFLVIKKSSNICQYGDESPNLAKQVTFFLSIIFCSIPRPNKYYNIINRLQVPTVHFHDVTGNNLYRTRLQAITFVVSVAGVLFCAVIRSVHSFFFFFCTRHPPVPVSVLFGCS